MLFFELQVINLIKPIAAVKRLSLSVSLAPDLPLCTTGDEKRLMQTILNIAGNAVKFTKVGHISITATVARPESLRDPRVPEFYPVVTDGDFYLRVQVLPYSPFHPAVQKFAYIRFYLEINSCKFVDFCIWIPGIRVGSGKKKCRFQFICLVRVGK